MNKLTRFGAALALGCAVLCMLAVQGLAQTTTSMTPAMIAAMPAATSTVIDLSPITTPLLQILGLVLTTMGVPLFWAGYNWMASRLHLNQVAANDAKRALIDRLLANGIGAAVEKIKAAQGAGIQVDVRSALVAHTYQYAVTHGPEVLGEMGLDQAKIAAMIRARIGLAMSSAAGSPVAAATEMAKSAA